MEIRYLIILAFFLSFLGLMEIMYTIQYMIPYVNDYIYTYYFLIPIRSCISLYIMKNIRDRIQEFIGSSLRNLLDDNLGKPVKVTENLWSIKTIHGPVFYTVKEDNDQESYIVSIKTQEDEEIILEPLGSAGLSLRPKDIRGCRSISSSHLYSSQINEYKGEDSIGFVCGDID